MQSYQCKTSGFWSGYTHVSSVRSSLFCKHCAKPGCQTRLRNNVQICDSNASEEEYDVRLTHSAEESEEGGEDGKAEEKTLQ